MRKAAVLSLWSTLFFCSALAYAAQPTILFTDLQSGPNSGGLNNQGTIVTIYGFGFGNTRGSSTVTLGGVAPAAYMAWSDKQISVQIGNAAVTGKIVVNVAGAGSSNGATFTVRSGRIFFVSSTGSDASSGSFTSPWATVRQAKNSAQAGDIIYLLNGVNETALDSSSATLAIAKSGTSGFPIAMVAYPGASVTIGSATGQSYGVRTTATSNYWTFAGINLRGAFSALNIASSNNWRIISNDITCPNGAGTGACVAVSGGAGIYMYRNRIHDSGSTTSTNIKPYQSVWFSNGTHAVDFGWNEIANTRSCSALQFSSTSGSLYNLTIRNNLIHDVRCDGISLNSIDPALGTVRAYNNVIYRAGTGPAPGGVEAHYTCISVGGTGSARVAVSNNTLYDCGKRANGDSGAISATAPVSMIDDIVQVLSGESYISPNSSLAEFAGNNNLFYGNGAVPSFSTASVHASAAFVDLTNSNFQLQSVSPAIDKGANNGISRDILQTPRPQGTAYDMGAYEFVGSATQSSTLTVTPSSLSFGNVLVGSSANQTVTLSNGSAASITVSGITVSGTGFNTTAPALPLTLAPGQSSSVTVTFAPQTSGAVTGTLQITSNATNSSASVSLSGTGTTTTQHSVALNWVASTSTVAGYNVYRATISGGPYSKLNSTLNAGTTFTDTSVSAGTTYYYVVTAVASDGTESVFSNQATAVVPTP